MAVAAAFGEGLVPEAERITDSVAFQVPKPIMELAEPERDEYLRRMAIISVFMGNQAPYEFHGCEWLVTNQAGEAAYWTPPHDCADCRDAIMQCIEKLEEDGSVWVALGKTEYTVYRPPSIVIGDLRRSGVKRIPL